MLKSWAILSTFFIVFLTTPLAIAMEPDPDDYMKEPEIQTMAAQDAITLSIREVRETRKFVKTILRRLKSVQQTQRLLPCVEGLVFDLSYIKSTLYKLSHLKPMHMLSDTKTLKKTMAQNVDLGKICSDELKGADEIVMSILVRKLGDLSTSIDDVIHNVSVIERDIHRA